MYKILIADDEWTHRQALIKTLRFFNEDFTTGMEAEDEAFKYPVKPVDKDHISYLLEISKILLDGKSKEIKDNTMRVLSEKLDFRIKELYEELIYTLLLNDTKELNFCIDELVSNHITLYGCDHSKLGVIFETLFKKIEEKLLSNFEFARKIYSIENFQRDSLKPQNDSTSISVVLKNQFSKLSQFIHLLHLEQADNTVKKLCEYVLQESDKRPTLAEASILLNYNSDYLGKLFKSKTGESFSSFSSKIKLEYAKKLLQNKIYKNYEISEMLGYKDVDYFSKLFKDYTGLSPSQYKKSFK